MSVPTTIIQKIENQFLRETKLPEFRPGDTLKVWVRITEGQKSRLQAFEGVCIRRHRGGNRSTFTVRKISYGVGVERVFAENSPNVDKIEIRARGKVRQSRLYYLRNLSGKAARIKERAFDRSQISSDESSKKGKRRGKRRKAAAKAATTTPASAPTAAAAAPPADAAAE